MIGVLEEAGASPGTGGPGNCELLIMCPENQTQVL